MSLYHPSRRLVQGSEKREICPVVVSDVSLSFWGGIDPETGIVIDATHPLHTTCIAGKILCFPSGRGSCTASQVLLELILNNKAPKALILRDRDGLVSVGALVADAIFPEAKANLLDIIQISDFDQLVQQNPSHGQILEDGRVVFGNDIDSVRNKVLSLSASADESRVQANLSAEEESMLSSAKSDAERRAFECIIRYAHILSDNPTYIDVKKAHIDGCTYIGPGGLQFAERLVEDGGSVKIPTTLNSVSTDLRFWERLGIIPSNSQQASIKLAEAYVALGCSDTSFTCAPYLLEGPPKLGEQIVWGESNAVVYANSVIGARTEKYADYLDICCAIVGMVPAVGVHLTKNRQPGILLDVGGVDLSTDDKESFNLLFPVLGHLCGRLADGEVPILTGLESYADHITSDNMKDFCAAFGTTGTSPLIHVVGITPEADEAMIANCVRKETIDADQLDATFKLLNQSDTNDDEERIDWISLGNPHLSLSECNQLVEYLERIEPPRKKHNDVQVIACMSRALHEQSKAVPLLSKFGVSFVNDTCWCMLLHPPMIPKDPNAVILTNSGKYAHYGPGLTGRKFRLGSMADCVEAAVSGKLKRRSTSNFPWKSRSRPYQSYWWGLGIRMGVGAGVLGVGILTDLTLRFCL